MTDSRPIKVRLNMSFFARLAWISYLPIKKIAAALKEHFPKYRFDVIDVNNDYFIVDAVVHGTSYKTRFITFRGTDFNNLTNNKLRDLADDFGIVINKLSYITRLRDIEKIVTRYITPHMFFVGHSLGGYIGAYMSRKFKKAARLFNIGSSPINHTTDTNPLVIHYTTNDIKRGIIDPLSITAVSLDNYKTYIVPVKKGLTIHTIDNFI